MSGRIEVSEVVFSPSSSSDVMTGLLGYIELTLGGGIRLTNIALRRTRAGELRLAFPVRRDRAGREHPLAYPVNPETREAVESQVLEALGLNREATR